MEPRPILVLADDDGDLRDVLAHVLEVEGFRVVPAVDGQHALDQLALNETPCAILLDWIMPRVGGEAFLTARAASAHLTSIPVFVISATHLPAGDTRIQGHLSKPFAVDDLLPMLRAVCGTHCPEERRARCQTLTGADRSVKM